MDHGVGAEKAIFIAGIKARCGTNFLTRLLTHHPECGAPASIGEDFLLSRSHLLGQYSDGVFKDWNGRWGVTDRVQAQLDASLGAGLISFLSDFSPRKRVVTKTPRVDNLDQFYRFFSAAKLIILVRDGRAIIESGMRSFNWRREGALHGVAEAAAKINQFVNNTEVHENHYRIVRYEDLWLDAENTLRGLFDFLDLDPDVYDYKSARRLSITGSSETAKNGAPIHWEPVAMSAEFDPMSRFDHWTENRHYRYNRIAGQEMELLGYDAAKISRWAWFYALHSLALDLAWAVFSRLTRFYRRMRSWLATTK